MAARGCALRVSVVCGRKSSSAGSRTYYRPGTCCPMQRAAGRAAAGQRPGQQRAGRGASRPWLHALSTRARTRCCQYIAHARRGFRRAGEHICAPLNAARLDGDAAAIGWRMRVPPRLHLTAVREGIVHAGGAAALTQNLVTWQRGQDDFVAPVRKLLPSERDIARAM